MSAWCESVSLSGFANWMTIQAQEEVSHADKIFGYLNERGGRVLLQPIEGPQTEWASILEVFEEVLEHEKLVTGLIHGLVKLARSESDYASETFLHWFVTEQVEEEASATAVVEKLKLAGDRGGGLLMLDREMAARVFTPPAAE
jgi:ferritin